MKFTNCLTLKSLIRLILLAYSVRFKATFRPLIRLYPLSQHRLCVSLFLAPKGRKEDERGGGELRRREIGSSSLLPIRLSSCGKSIIPLCRRPDRLEIGCVASERASERSKFVSTIQTRENGCMKSSLPAGAKTTFCRAACWQIARLRAYVASWLKRRRILVAGRRFGTGFLIMPYGKPALGFANGRRY